MDELYHCCPIPLEIGSVIKPGNWGRVLHLYNSKQVNFVLMREYMLEAYRQNEYPDKPSRLNAVFCLPTEEEAKKYQNNNNEWSIIYKVAPIKKAYTIHNGDYGLVSPKQDLPFLLAMESTARRY